MFSLHQVSVQFPLGVFSLSVSELQIPNEGVTAIVGKNGSGKSTLLSLMAGTRAPDSGTCTFEGRSCFQAYDQIKRDVQLLSWNTVFDTRLKPIAYIKLLRRICPKWNLELEQRLIQEFSIPLDQSIATLSRGEHAKLKLLLAICQNPKVLLIDELTNDLDSSSRKAIFNLIDEKVFEAAVSVVWATNILTDVERFANQLVVMQKGSVLLHEKIEDFRARHQKVALHNQSEMPKPKIVGLEDSRIEWDGKNGLLYSHAFDAHVEKKLKDQNINFNLLPYSLNEILANYGAE